jgi:hypothetical protein
MAPPEVILDRLLRNEPEFSRYLGKVDIERVEPPSFRALLSMFQNEINEALRKENTNASGGVEHPPFHFDYVDSAVEKNAYAFQHEGFSFVVVTLPLVKSIVDVSQRLSRSEDALRLLHLDWGAFEPDILQGVLAQIQLLFLTSHEYTHHVHKHVSGGYQGRVWTEFPQGANCGNIDSQVEELDADYYAAYLVLTHLLRGERRQSALIQLERTNMPATDCDEMLLSCFLLAVLAFFCALSRWDVAQSAYQLTHPPRPVRIRYAIKAAEMWCRQFGSVPQSWFSSPRLQDLLRVANEAGGETTRPGWDVELSILSSADGALYERLLLEKFEAVRRSE